MGPFHTLSKGLREKAERNNTSLLRQKNTSLLGQKNVDWEEEEEGEEEEVQERQHQRQRKESKGHTASLSPGVPRHQWPWLAPSLLVRQTNV